MTKEKPILFSTEMVKAILDGRKTQTRRIMNIPLGYQLTGGGLNALVEIISYPSGEKKYIMPKYCIGNVLWVRETWRYAGNWDVGGAWVVDFKDGTSWNCDRFSFERECKFSKFRNKDGWQSPLYMPKEAARIHLRVTGVRCESLREITPEDKIAEGFSGCARAYPCQEKDICDKKCFQKLWDSINGKKAGKSWKDNPLVFVYEFERIEKC